MSLVEYKTTLFLDNQKSRPTFYVYWYPIKEFAFDAKKPHEMNMYTKGGPLEKYDAAFNKKSKDYEYTHSRQPNDPSIRMWEGHCK